MADEVAAGVAAVDVSEKAPAKKAPAANAAPELIVLLQHLAANRQPCFREYMRLKNDGTAEGEDEERWTNLNALEESFVELNHSHVDHFVGPALPTVA